MEPDARMASLEATICRQTADVCSEALGPHLSAIVLTGSMARSEATVIEKDRVARVLGDAEFFLVFKEQAKLPSDAALDALIARIESQLSEHGVRCDVELTPVHPQYFSSLQPTIFGFELRACGRVVWGDPCALSLIPPFSAADIPRQDAWRLLVNRMIECLEVAPQLLEGESRATQGFSYRRAKLYLDMATSFLVFAGEFRPTYKARAQILQELAEQDEVGKQWPLLLRDFSQQVARCTDFKLGRGEGPSFLRAEDQALARTVEDASQLWRWELAQLTGVLPGAADWELMERWMHRQALSERVRGWLVVLRGSGWHSSWRNWPRWLRLARRASPRYWVYALASELFFAMPDLLASPSGGRRGASTLPPKALSFEPLFQGISSAQRGSSWATRIPALPIRLSPQGDSPDWVELALDVAANYHRFLEHTES